MRSPTLVVLILISAIGLTSCRQTNDNSARNNSKTSQSNSSGQLIDLNSASKAELVRLPGIGETYAQRIIDHRPYREKTDLLSRNIIPENAYRQISDKVIAKQH